MGSRIERLKQKWGIDSTRRVIAILIAFSLAGLSVVQCRTFIFALFRFDHETPFALKTITYLLLLFPLYQILLLGFGTILGEFRFFWEKEKAMARWLLRRLKPPSPTTEA
ncbi:MAG TPA: hypothetical protein PKE55_05760 [Kiritimatiellia bacterium]|nr:hypothetical protein [Kiritimatiellia bacterium]